MEHEVEGGELGWEQGVGVVGCCCCSYCFWGGLAGMVVVWLWVWDMVAYHLEELVEWMMGWLLERLGLLL